MGSEVARLFDAMAGSYDELEPWYEHLYQCLHAILASELAPAGGAGSRALDAGCGTGFQTALLSQLGYRVHGIDLSPGLLAVARKRLPGVALVQGDLAALPYADATFDAVSCCGSTLSFVDDPARVLRELGRVLRPTGRLFLECEHKWSLDLLWALVDALGGNRLGYGTRLADLRRQLARPLTQGFSLDYPVKLTDGAEAAMRLRLFTLDEIRAMLAAADLLPVRIWGIHAVTNVIPSTMLHRERLSRRLSLLYRALCVLDRALGAHGARRFANSLVVLATKRGPVAGAF